MQKRGQWRTSDDQARLETCSTCSKNTEPIAKGKGAKREMNTVKFWLEPALRRTFGNLPLRTSAYKKIQAP
jgi:hypothetical protein